MKGRTGRNHLIAVSATLSHWTFLTQPSLQTNHVTDYCLVDSNSYYELCPTSWTHAHVTLINLPREERPKA